MSLSLLAVALAQTPAELPETVVIETRQRAPLAEASPSVSRLDVAQATEAGTTTLAGLLGSAPGVFSTEQSGEGSQASLFLRGTNSSQTAVLLDGRRLPQGFSNNYEIGRYRIFGLSSVEILRGPSSSLYGANALGGVIDLRLAQPLADKPLALLSLEGGSYGRASAGVSFLTNNAAQGQPATQGVSVAVTSTHDDGWRDNGARDATTALVKSEWRLAPHLTLDLIGSTDFSKAGLPGQASPSVPADPNDTQKDSGWLLSPGLRYDDGIVSAAVFWSHAGSAVTSFIDGTNFWGPYEYDQRFLLARDEITAYADWRARKDLSLGLGVSYERSNYEQLDLTTSSVFWQDTQESLGAWVRADWQATAADRFRATVRTDRFTEFAGKTTGEFAYAHKLDREYSVHAKIASAYRAPAANDLAYGTSGGLPLRPESNTGYEVGLRHENAVPGALSWTLVAFQNNLTDLIDYNPADYQTYNIAKARTRGLELGAEARPAKGLRCFGAVTVLDTEVLSASGYLGTASAGDSLLRRPTLSVSAGIEVIPNDDWVFGFSASHLRGREDFDFNANARVDLPNATFCRLWVRRVLDDKSEVSLRVENLFGEDAPPAAYGFGAQPRSAYVGYTRRF
jgi:vitamin B12 transporter